MPPEPPGVGEAVQQDDRPAAAGHLILGADPVDVYPAHRTRRIRAMSKA